MAFRAAQTGHLLLSTLHTNSAIATLPRLLDLGIESSLIASSLIGVLSQRLVRKVCTQCRQEDMPSQKLLDEFFKKVPSDLTFYRGAGCGACAREPDRRGGARDGSAQVEAIASPSRSRSRQRGGAAAA